MAQTAAAQRFTAEAFDAFLSSRHEPDWLVDLRRSAWKMFTELDLPSRRQEEWIRTDVRLLHLERFGLPDRLPSAAAVPQRLLTKGVELGGETVALNSHPVAARVAKELAGQGVLFGSLDTLAAEHGELLKPYLMRAVEPPADKFAALHAACFSGGTLLLVPRGVQVEQPLHAFSALAEGGVDLGHTLVILEEGAQATLLAETGGDEQPGLHCGATELFVGPGAKLRYVHLQNWGTGVWHFAHQKAIVEKDGSLQWTIGALGSRLAKVNQHVALVGQNARAEVNGAMFAEGRQHLAYHTLQHHEAARCKSELLYKGGLQDKSQIVWRGMIRVDPGAQKSDGYQRDDNLILSPEARVDSIPGLEISADDVRCTHGATVARVDEEQVFYARCHGLTRQEAIRMIVAGFFQQVFDRITMDNVREALGEAIGRRIREYE